MVPALRKDEDLMKGSVIAASLALALSAAPAFAQAASGQAKPAPRPAAPATSTPAPAPAQAAPAPPPVPVPFPAGAKIAYVNLQLIANQSAEGKALTAKVQALMKKQHEAQTKQKQLADAQQKLQQGGALLSEAASSALQKDIERMNVEGQRFQQDAQAEINELSQQLQGEFQQKLFPILDALVKEHDLHLLLSAADAGIVAGNAGIDLTMEAVRKLDEKTLAGGAKPAGTSGAAAPATAK